MIAFIKGELISKAEDHLVLENNGIGYNIRISTETANLLPNLGAEVKIHTYTYVREDAFLLYGFLTLDDLEIFKKLITVNGIGPKGGLAILSVMSAQDLRFAIYTGDAKAISKAPGVGAKTAERVILDLRDKISIEETLYSDSSAAFAVPVGAEDNTARNEAVEALVALGYGASEAMKAVKQVEIQPDTDVQDVLKLALKKLF